MEGSFSSPTFSDSVLFILFTLSVFFSLVYSGMTLHNLDLSVRKKVEHETLSNRSSGCHKESKVEVFTSLLVKACLNILVGVAV